MTCGDGVGLNGRKLPRSNESPGDPGIHSFEVIRLAPVTETELDLGFVG